MSLSTPEADTVNVPFDELVAILTQTFKRHGLRDDVAAMLACNCASAERDGAKSHGLFRIAGYISTIASGWVDGNAFAHIEHERGSFIRVHGNNGFAQPALALAVPKAMALARENGIAVVSLHDSHHFGALWLDLEPIAREGFVGLNFVNGYKRVAAHGGRRAVYGTNPMAFATPRSQANPLIFDQASSAMSYGDTRLAANAGETVPLGTGIDKQGNATVDPGAILDGGSMLTFGGHKGSSIAMMIEVLAGALTGAMFSFEVDRSAYAGAETSRSGQTLILIDPQAGSAHPFGERVETLIEQLHKSGQSRMPGDRRYRQREISLREGICIESAMLRYIREA